MDRFELGEGPTAGQVPWAPAARGLRGLEAGDDVRGVDGGRLPTEAEWKYAARSGGKGWKDPWGNRTATCERAVMDDGGDGCGKNRTWPRCSKPAGNTKQGLCDMAGNVWESVADWYHDDYDGASTDGSTWASPAGSDRVGRSSFWFNVARRGRAADRHDFGPGHRGSDLEFRVARSGP